jgi:Kef-type K+ transport system membrane component KefB
MERPRSLQAAAGLVAVQALGLGVWGAVEVVQSIVGHPSDRTTAVILGIVLLCYAVGVLLDARGLWRARRWSQSLAYMVSFFAVAIGYGQIHTLLGLAIGLIAVGVATFAALTAPASRRALGGI